MNKIFIENEKEMINFAKKLAQNCKIYQIYCLTGTLGSGKTFFSKYFISHLTKEDPSIISSPTFNIYNNYKSENLDIYHFDLYRIKNDQELDNIGFYDLLKNGIILIEWPEIAKNYLKQDFINIDFQILDNNQRILTIKEFIEN
jgi:tRNA threonylcarbamoyladenosine biosynthesis protein TsaE